MSDNNSGKEVPVSQDETAEEIVDTETVARTQFAKKFIGHTSEEILETDEKPKFDYRSEAQKLRDRANAIKNSNQAEVETTSRQKLTLNESLTPVQSFGGPTLNHDPFKGINYDLGSWNGDPNRTPSRPILKNVPILGEAVLIGAPPVEIADSTVEAKRKPPPLPPAVSLAENPEQAEQEVPSTTVVESEVPVSEQTPSKLDEQFARVRELLAQARTRFKRPIPIKAGIDEDNEETGVKPADFATYKQEKESIEKVS